MSRDHLPRLGHESGVGRIYGHEGLQIAGIEGLGKHAMRILWFAYSHSDLLSSSVLKLAAEVCERTRALQLADDLRLRGASTAKANAATAPNASASLMCCRVMGGTGYCADVPVRGAPIYVSACRRAMAPWANRSAAFRPPHARLLSKIFIEAPHWFTAALTGAEIQALRLPQLR
jgi:hypothetical protein